MNQLLYLNYQYIPTPKCGCTSIKNLIYLCNYQELFSSNPKRGIHQFYPTTLFADQSNASNTKKFIVIRDPLERFLSAFKDRVLNHPGIKIKAVRDKKLPTEVSFKQFVYYFLEYYELSEPINWHFRPQIDFIGNDPSIYDRIFFFKNLQNIPVYLQTDHLLPHVKSSQKYNHLASLLDLERYEISFLKNFYEQDYQFIERCLKL